MSTDKGRHPKSALHEANADCRMRKVQSKDDSHVGILQTNKTGRFPKGTFPSTTCETNVTDSFKMKTNTTFIDENSVCLNHVTEYEYL